MARDIRVNIVGHDKLSRAVDQAHGKLTGFRGRTAGILAGLGIGTALVSGLRSTIGAARESNAVSKETETRIREMGNAANVTANQVGDLSEAISNKTGVDDEAVQSGANMLLTFGNIRNEAGAGRDIFNQATLAATNMAAKFGGDASRQAITLGKALDNPSKGLSALTRIGVTFTEQEKARIKAMQESGDMAGAQGLILQSVNRQVAGAAEANTTAQDKLAVKLGNIQERIGNGLVPILDKLATFVTNNTGLVLGAVGAVAGLVAVVKVVTAVSKAWTAVQTVLNFVLTANPVGVVVLAIAALIAIVVLAYRRSEIFRNIVQGAFRAVLAAARALGSGAIAAFNALVAGGGRIISFFRELPGRIVSFLAGLPGRMLDLGRRLIQAYIDGIRSMAGAIISTISSIIPGPIKRFLKLESPAEEGPLSEGGGPEAWGEKLAALYARGVARGSRSLPGALSGLAGGAVGIGGPGGLLAAAGGPSITVHARTNADAAEIAREVAWTMRTSGR